MSDTRKLGLTGKALVALMVVVTAGLVVGAGVVIRAKTIEQEKRAQSTLLLDRVAAGLRTGGILAPAPTSTEGSGDRTGQGAVGNRVRSRLPRTEIVPSFGRERQEAFRDWLSWYREPLLDAWSHPIYYRCPGPIHKNGWDLISCGPNGVYEEGQGDDIVVGEDLAGGLAAISSESGTATEAK